MEDVKLSIYLVLTPNVLMLDYAGPGRSASHGLRHRRNWTLGELANVACVSPRHISRLFALHTVISAVVYLQQLRLARAQAMLAYNPTLSQERLAQACGFGSARDFRRVLKKL